MVASSAGGAAAPSASTGTGYVMGGYNYPPGPLSSVATLAFAGEYTGSSSAVLSHAKAYTTSAGFSSQVRGHSCSGDTVNTAIDGVVFATDTGFLSAATMSPYRSNVTSVASSMVGYMMGGGAEVVGTVTTIDGVDFASDAHVEVSAVLSLKRQEGASCQSSLRGFYMGGWSSSSSYSKRIDGITFDVTPAAFSQGDALGVGNVQSSGHSALTKGYRVGGIPWSGSITNINTIDFSTYAVGISSMTTASNRGYSTPVQSVAAGYTIGSNIASDIGKIDFSAETRSIIGATIARMQAAGAQSPSSGLVATGGGYVMGGINSSGQQLPDVQKIDFSTEGASTTSSALQEARAYSVGVSSATRGYAISGQPVLTAGLNIVGVTFSSDSSFVSGAVVNQYRYLAGGAQSDIKGYSFGGINFSTYQAYIHGVKFAEDSFFTSNASLSQARFELSGVSSAQKGYMFGGYTSSYSTRVDGIIFGAISDTAFNLGALLSTNIRADMAGCATSANGYIMGGGNGASRYGTISRMVFSADTLSDIGTALPTPRTHPAGVSSAIKGYVIGGHVSSSVAEIDGIEFAGETAINPTASLVTGSYLSAGTQSPSTAPTGWTLGRGYVMGGTTTGPTTVTTVNYVSFYGAYSAATASSLPSARLNYVGASSTTSGYVMGKKSAGVTTADGITFSSEQTFSTSASLGKVYYLGVGTSSAIHGYYMGGTEGFYADNSIYKLAFSNNTSSESNVLLLGAARYSGVGVMSSTKGYCIGGYTGGTESSDISGVVFGGASDTAFTSAVSVGAWGGCGSSSLTDGYVFHRGMSDSGIARLAFSSSDVLYSVSATLADHRSGSTCVYSSSTAYITGGSLNGYFTTIQRFIYSSGVRDKASSVLSSTRTEAAGAQPQ